MCLRARITACVVLACVLRVCGQTQECKKNEFLYHEYNAFFKWSRYYCKQCEWGKYGWGGQCYACPYFFTRERRYKDAATTLWCSNSCALMFDNQHALKGDLSFDGVQNVDDAEKAVYQYDHGVYVNNHWGYGRVGEKFEFAVCKTCTNGKFMMTLQAKTVLAYYRADLVAMQFSEDDIGKVTAMQDRLQDFTWSICSSCPEGFAKANKWFLPPSMVEESSGNIVEIGGKMIPCSACSVQYGVPQKENNVVVCKRCAEGFFQLAREVSFIPYTMVAAEWNGLRSSLVVGVECQTCPPGQQVTSTQSQCRGLSAAACCLPCAVNQIKGTATGRCQRVGTHQVAQLKADDNTMHFVLSGGTHERACGSGEQLFYCYDGVCQKSASFTEAWKTCLPCSLDQTSRSSGTASGCPACSVTQQHVVDTNELTRCTTCSLCEEIVESTLDIPLKDVGSAFLKVTETFTVRQVKAQCAPLQQRTLKKTSTQPETLFLSGQEHWRDAKKTKGEVLPYFHFVDRVNSCQKKPCSHVCRSRFQYSDGCGNSVPDADVWVQSPAGVQQYKKKLAQLQASAISDVSQWTVLSQGHCQFCQHCVRGWYNDGCNQNYESGSPQGVCKPCKSSCVKGFFMSHPEQDAGCHDPPAHQYATDNSSKFQILYDYTCQPCPRWVIKNDKLYVVAACGAHDAGDTYTYFKAGVAELTSTEKLVVPEAGGEDVLAEGVRRKNFRTFRNNLLPYCPSEYFFDAQITGCGFVRVGTPWQLGGQVTVQVGYEAYNPRCCKPCGTCAPPTERKDMNRWRDCDGADMENVQKHCVDKCVIGYWEEAETKRCQRCSACHDGMQL